MQESNLFIVSFSYIRSYYYSIIIFISIIYFYMVLCISVVYNFIQLNITTSYTFNQLNKNSILFNYIIFNIVNKIKLALHFNLVI